MAITTKPKAALFMDSYLRLDVPILARQSNEDNRLAGQQAPRAVQHLPKWVASILALRYSFKQAQLQVMPLLRHTQTHGSPRSYRSWSSFGPIRVA